MSAPRAGSRTGRAHQESDDHEKSQVSDGVAMHGAGGTGSAGVVAADESSPVAVSRRVPLARWCNGSGVQAPVMSATNHWL